MADSTIHALTNAGAPVSTDEFLIVRSPFSVGTDRKITWSSILAAVGTSSTDLTFKSGQGSVSGDTIFQTAPGWEVLRLGFPTPAPSDGTFSPQYVPSMTINGALVRSNITFTEDQRDYQHVFYMNVTQPVGGYVITTTGFIGAGSSTLTTVNPGPFGSNSTDRSSWVGKRIPSRPIFSRSQTITLLSSLVQTHRDWLSRVRR
jgi:hypothetical protein